MVGSNLSLVSNHRFIFDEGNFDFCAKNSTVTPLPLQIKFKVSLLISAQLDVIFHLKVCLLFLAHTTYSVQHQIGMRDRRCDKVAHRLFSFVLLSLFRWFEKE